MEGGPGTNSRSRSQGEFELVQQALAFSIFLPSSSSHHSFNQTKYPLTDFQITALFRCPPTSTESISLACFIAHCFNRTLIPPLVLPASLLLLYRIHHLHPRHEGSSGYRLFLAAMMVAHKSLHDSSFSAASWTIVGRAMGGDIEVEQVNKMERELLDYARWDVVITSEELKTVEASFPSASFRDRRLDWGILSSLRPSLPPGNDTDTLIPYYFTLITPRAGREVHDSFSPLSSFDPPLAVTPFPRILPPSLSSTPWTSTSTSPFLPYHPPPRPDLDPEPSG